MKNKATSIIKKYFFLIALAAIAAGSSAYTKTTANEALAGEVYVNTSTLPDQYQILTSTYDDSNCLNSSGMKCAYIRTNLEPDHELPSSFTDEEAEEFVDAGWLAPHSNREGIYTP